MVPQIHASAHERNERLGQFAPSRQLIGLDRPEREDPLQHHRRPQKDVDHGVRPDVIPEQKGRQEKPDAELDTVVQRIPRAGARAFE